MVSVGQEVGSGLAGLFRPRISHDAAITVAVRDVVIWDLTGWRIHFQGHEMAACWRHQFLVILASLQGCAHRTATGFLQRDWAAWMSKSMQDGSYRFHNLTLKVAYYYFCMVLDIQINTGTMWVENTQEYGKQNVSSLGPSWTLKVDYHIMPSGP